MKNIFYGLIGIIIFVAVYKFFYDLFGVYGIIVGFIIFGIALAIFEDEHNKKKDK